LQVQTLVPPKRKRKKEKGNHIPVLPELIELSYALHFNLFISVLLIKHKLPEKKFFWRFFEAGSHYKAQTGLELTM
jgi:hypothetical protein